MPGRKWATQLEAAQDSVMKFLSFVPFPILYRKSNHSRGNSFDTLMPLLFRLLSGTKPPNHCELETLDISAEADPIPF